MYIDYYKVLGVDRNATQGEIRSAYRRLARKFHPDLNPNDMDAKRKFQEINEAHEVLHDPEKRKKYDQYGENWKHAEEFEKAGQYREQESRRGSRGYQWTADEERFSDFFESLFGEFTGRGKSRQVKFKGQDYSAELNLNLIDAYETHQRTLNVNNRKIRITIPAGIENGQTIKIPGHGGNGVNDGPAGDLYITFHIANHPRFRRLGNDLYTNVDLDLYTAVLGGEITIETLKGKVKLKVKPETQNGSKVKLKGKGFPLYKRDDQYGDLYITYMIKIPTDLSGREKQLFIELSKSRSK
jgi:curved DNA-binding protein